MPYRKVAFILAAVIAALVTGAKFEYQLTNKGSIKLPEETAVYLPAAFVVDKGVVEYFANTPLSFSAQRFNCVYGSKKSTMLAQPSELKGNPDVGVIG